MKRVVLVFGLIAGAVMAAMLVLATIFRNEIGFDRSALVGYTSMVMAFLMVFFGIRQYRDNSGGAISFGRACGVGLLIVAVATVCYVASWEFVYTKMMPDFTAQYTAYAIQKAKASGASEAKVAAVKKQMGDFATMYKNPVTRWSLTFLEPLPVGVLMTLIAAGVLRRKSTSA